VKKVNLQQGTFFEGLGEISTRVISRKEDFESLFDGFTKMHAVSFVVSSDLLREFIQKRGYTDVEVVVGDDLAEPALRQELQDKAIETIEALAQCVEKGSLRIFIPRRPIHTKLYILARDNTMRLIQTSANLTETARKAVQVNYAWYVDLPIGHEFVQRVLEDFQVHDKSCSLFMGDLIDLFKERQDTPRQELIEVWVKGEVLPAPELETAKVFQEISAQTLLVSDSGLEADIVTVKLPETPAAKKELERLLKPIKPTVTAGTVSVRSSTFVNYVHSTYGIPLMRIDTNKGNLRLGLKGTVLSLSEPLPEAKQVDDGLAHIEDYVQTIDLGRSLDPTFAKSSMFEALLYLFFTPFANEYMKQKRLTYGQVDPKGPRFLYIYGPTQNGKTTFLRFVLKLITGEDIEALPREEFTVRKIRGAATVGTVFPLVFDDIEFSRRPWVQDVVKAYWETWWRSTVDIPQLVLASNEPRLQDWARSRVKRTDFDVHFSSTEDGKKRLKELFERGNNTYRWFSYLYLKHLAKDERFSDDELYVARAVMRELYDYASRTRPQFFLDQPVEKTYDLGKQRWGDLLFLRREAKVIREHGRILVRFPAQMQHWEIRHYEGYLPPEVKARQEGHTIIIETPEDFDLWCTQPRSRLWPFGR